MTFTIATWVLEAIVVLLAVPTIGFVIVAAIFGVMVASALSGGVWRR